MKIYTVMYDYEDPRARAAFEMDVATTVDTYLNTDPRPSVLSVADFFGMEHLVQSEKHGIILHIPDVKKELTSKLWEQAKNNGTHPQPPILPEYLQHTVTPPDEGEITTGSGTGFEQKEMIPRTRYLVEFLETNNIIFDQPFGGKNTSDMMRGIHSYYLFYLPELKVAINVNNQEGNATFIFYDVASREVAKDITLLSKKDYANTEKNPFPYTSLDWTADAQTWQDNLLDKLTTPPTAKEKSLQLEIISSSRAQERRTPKTALRELNEAHTHWKALAKAERGRFNVKWLRKNGYGGLYNWMWKNGGIEVFIVDAPEEIQRDFERLERKNPIAWTQEKVRGELTQAHAQWKALPEDTRGKFNAKWLEKNGYKRLHHWMWRNGGIEKFIAKAPEEIQRDFEKQEQFYNRTIETVQSELIKAHNEWKALPEDTRGKFNVNWLEKNGYMNPYSWMHKHGGIEKFIAKAPEEIQRDFEKREHFHRRTADIAQSELTQAHAQWKALPEDTRGKFNVTWLQKNGYKRLHHWMWRNGGIEKFIAKAPEEIQRDFEKQVQRKKAK